MACERDVLEPLWHPSSTASVVADTVGHGAVENHFRGAAPDGVPPSRARAHVSVATQTISSLRELIDSAHLISTFAVRDIRVRYKQTVLGVGWAVFQPLSLMLAFSLVFGSLARVPTHGVPYPIFAYSTLVFWMFFSTAMVQGTLSIMANAALVRKVFFPREILVLAVLLSTGFDLAVALSFLLALLVYYHIAITWVALWIVPLFFTQVVFTLALTLITSTLHVRFRDIAHVLPLALQVWMFVTPVAYPLDAVPGRWRTLYVLNPMAPIIEGYRRILLHHTPPEQHDVGVVLAVSLVLLSLAYLVFKRAERTFADIL
jgi:homopolymeric O-antigen transport system permease protein